MQIPREDSERKRPPPGRKTTRTRPSEPSPLAEPILIDEWKKIAAAT